MASNGNSCATSAVGFGLCSRSELRMVTGGQRGLGGLGFFLMGGSWRAGLRLAREMFLTSTVIQSCSFGSLHPELRLCPISASDKNVGGLESLITAGRMCSQHPAPPDREQGKPVIPCWDQHSKPQHRAARLFLLSSPPARGRGKQADCLPPSAPPGKQFSVKAVNADTMDCSAVLQG